MYKTAQNLPIIFVRVEQQQYFPFHIGNMETSSVHPSPSGSDCDDNYSVTPVSLDAVVDIVNVIVDAGPTVCSMSHLDAVVDIVYVIVDAGPTVSSMLHADKTFTEKNHDMAVVMAMAEGAVYKGEPILVKALEEAIINAKKKKKLFTKAGYLKDEINQRSELNSLGINRSLTYGTLLGVLW